MGKKRTGAYIIPLLHAKSSFETLLRNQLNQDDFHDLIENKYRENSPEYFQELSECELFNRSKTKFKNDQKDYQGLSLPALATFFHLVLTDYLNEGDEKNYLGHSKKEDFLSLYDQLDRESLIQIVKKFEQDHSPKSGLREIYNRFLLHLTEHDRHPFGRVQLTELWHIQIDNKVYEGIHQAESKSVYIGRERELSIVRAFIENPTTNFLLVTGFGGVGKSSLIKQVINDLNWKQTIVKDCGQKNKISDIRLQNICDFLRVDFDVNNPGLNRQKIVSKINEMGSEHLLVFDNIHTVKDPEVLDLFEELYSLEQGKVILVSRDIPDTLHDNKTICVRPLIIGLLEFEDFNSLIDDWTSPFGRFAGIVLNPEERSAIYKAIHGHPMLCQFVLSAMAEHPLEKLLFNLPKIDLLSHEATTAYSSYLLNIITQDEDREEIELLHYLSALNRPENLDFISGFPSFNKRHLDSLRLQKLFVILEDKHYQVHDLIAEFAYERIHDKESVHQNIAELYIHEIEAIEIFDADLTSCALHHLQQLGNLEPIDSFRANMLNKFAGKKTKSFLSDSIKSNIQTYLTLVSLHPNSLKFRSQLSVQYRHNKNWDVGFSFVKSSLELFPDDAHLLLEAAKYQLQFGDHQAAKNFIDQIAANKRISPYVFECKMKILLSEKDLIGAEQCLIEAVKFNPEHPIANAMYLDLLKVKITEKILVDEPSIIKEINLYSFNVLCSLGVSFAKFLSNKGLLKASILAFKKLLCFFPDDIEIASEIAYGQIHLGDINEATQILSDAILKNPDDNVARRVLVRTYLYLSRNPKLAEDAARSMAGKNRDYYRSLTEIGIQYQSLDDLKKAVELFDEVFRSEYCSQTVVYRLALVRAKLGNLPLAKTLLDELQSDYHRSELAAYIAYLEGDFKSSLRLYEQLIDDYEKITDPSRIILAELYEKTGQIWSAIDQLREVSPKNTIARCTLCHLLQEVGSFDEAEDIGLEVLKKNPENIRIMTILGEMYTKQQNWEGAIEQFENALTIDPKNSIACRGLAHVYELNRSLRMSIHLLKRAMSYPENLKSIEASFLITAILRSYSRLHDESGFNTIKENLPAHLKTHPHIESNNYRKDTKIAVRLHEVGKIQIKNGKGLILGLPTSIGQIWHRVSKSSFLKDGELVYYGIYNIYGRQVIECVEPYFESDYLAN